MPFETMTAKARVSLNAAMNLQLHRRQLDTYEPLPETHDARQPVVPTSLCYVINNSRYSTSVDNQL